jgi:hypothetical protein
MPDRSDHHHDDERSAHCRRGDHVGCPHQWGVGGGLNPRKLRLETGYSLCRCSCHAACPVTSPGQAVIPQEVWYASCACPGGVALRQRRDDAGIRDRDFAGYRAERASRRQAREEAGEAALARAGRSSREEFRQAYVAELQARQLSVPADPVLDATVDHILGGGKRRSAIRALGAILGQLRNDIQDV